MAAAAVQPKHDILSDLVFWKSQEKPVEPIDFSLAGSEKLFDDLKLLDESHKVLIKDIRGEEENFTLEKNGFQYFQHEVKGLAEATSEDEIRDLLIPASEELVRKATGAYKTITFTHRIRSLATDEAKRADNRAPAHSVHSDFTTAGALNHLKTVVKDPEEVEKLLSGRVLFINVWRPLKEIKKDPLAVSDWSSLDAADIQANRMIFPQFWSELGKLTYKDSQRWHYLSHQKPSEPLVFKQFDSKAEGGATVPHSAFVNPEYVDSDPRESIEIKMIAFVA